MGLKLALKLLPSVFSAVEIETEMLVDAEYGEAKCEYTRHRKKS